MYCNVWLEFIKTTELEKYNVCRTVAFLVTAKKWIMAVMSAILDKSQLKVAHTI